MLRIDPELEDLLLLDGLNLVGHRTGLHRHALVGEVRHLLGEGRRHFHRRRLPVEVPGRRAGERHRRTLRVESPAYAARLRNVPRLVRRVHIGREVGVLAAARDAADEVRDRFLLFAERPMIGNEMLIRRRGSQVIRLHVRNRTLLQVVRDQRLRRRRLVKRPAPIIRLRDVARDIRRVALHLEQPLLVDPADKIRDVRRRDAVRQPVIGNPIHINRLGRKLEIRLIRHRPVRRRAGNHGNRRRRRVERPGPRGRPRDIARGIRRIHARRVGAVTVLRRADKVRHGRLPHAQRPVIGNEVLIRRCGGEIVCLHIGNRALRRRAGNHGIRRRLRINNPVPEIGRRDVPRLIRRIDAHRIVAIRQTVPLKRFIW